MKLYTFHLTGHEAQKFNYRLSCLWSWDNYIQGGWYASLRPLDTPDDLVLEGKLAPDIAGPYWTERSARKRAPKDPEAENEDTV